MNNTCVSKGMALAVVTLSITCCAAAQQTLKTRGEYSGDLVGALEFISTTFHLPVIAELTKSYPTHVLIPPDQDTADQVLGALNAQLTGYTWVNRDGVVLFFDSRLRNARGNFFNANIARFVMPGNLADLVLELNQVMGSEPNTAPVMVGVPEKALAAVNLRQREAFTNVTGREILVEAAKQSHNLFSVVLFPASDPKTGREIDEAHRNWYVRSIDELPRNPTHLRSIPPEP